MSDGETVVSIWVLYIEFRSATGSTPSKVWVQERGAAPTKPSRVATSATCQENTHMHGGNTHTQELATFNTAIIAAISAEGRCVRNVMRP